MISFKAINIPVTGIHSQQYCSSTFIVTVSVLWKHLWERWINIGALVTGISFHFQGNNFINKSQYLGIWTSSRKKTSNPISELCEALLISEKHYPINFWGSNGIPLLCVSKQYECVCVCVCEWAYSKMCAL